NMLLLDADDGPGHRARLGGVRRLHRYLDLFAACLVEDLAKRRVAGQVDGKALEGPLDGSVGVVGDGGDVAAIEIAQHHRLEQVVDVGDGEAEVDARMALDTAFALEVADAAAEEHDLADRKLHRLGRRWLVLSFFRPGGRQRGPQQKERRAGRDAERRGSKESPTHGNLLGVCKEWARYL